MSEHGEELDVGGELARELGVEEATHPYIEDLMWWARYFGIEPTLENALELVRRLASDGALWEAYRILMLAVCNFTSPPTYFYIIPKNHRPVAIHVEEIREKEEYRVTVEYRAYGTDKTYRITLYMRLEPKAPKSKEKVWVTEVLPPEKD